MIFPVRAPHIVECVAVFQHLDCGVQCQRLGGGRCTQRLAGRAVAESRRTCVAHAKAAVRCNLCIAQSNPDSRLRCGKVHIRCEVARGQRCLHPADKLVQSRAGIAACRHAVNVHIGNFSGNGIRLAAGSRIGFRMVGAVCANCRAIRCFGVHRPYITRRTVLPKPCFLRPVIRDVVGFADPDFDSGGFVVLVCRTGKRYTHRHAGKGGHSCQNSRCEPLRERKFHKITCFFAK